MNTYIVSSKLLDEQYIYCAPNEPYLQAMMDQTLQPSSDWVIEQVTGPQIFAIGAL